MFDRLSQRLGRASERYPEQAPASGATADRGPGFLASWWAVAVGAVLTVAGAAGALWGLVSLHGALAPDNVTNPLREIGVVIGVGALVVGAVPCLGGLALVVASSRRRRRVRPSA
ncbi:hypothetical protein [Terrabacter carboxydivorans]|uniref:Uncharacterized protein n=1 Tax=Terrabacter carboxydivorans TaxID=619730 RepID=A0ABP5YQ78_9MICO